MELKKNGIYSQKKENKTVLRLKSILVLVLKTKCLLRKKYFSFVHDSSRNYYRPFSTNKSDKTNLHIRIEAVNVLSCSHKILKK